MPLNSKFNLFISYAHDNKQYFDVFLKKLQSHFDLNRWNIWTDRNIAIGTDWFESIQKAMQQSDAAMLLISAEFFSSGFIKEHEYSKFNELNTSNPGFVFLPILLCDCEFTRWNEQAKLQMFAANGDEYGIPEKQGQLIPFAEICEFDRNSQLIPNAKIDTYIKNLVKKAETQLNIVKSLTENNGEKSMQAKEIDKLQNLKNIFLSLPVSDDGNKIRENFIFEVDKKIKYEKPMWPYEITPGYIEGKEISKTLNDAPEKILSKLPDKFIYSILIIASDEDLKKLQETKQYELAKKTNADSDINHTILWFLNSEIKGQLDQLDEPFKLELKMLPAIVGNDVKSIFNLIEQFDVDKEKKKNKLETSFSPERKLCIFYDDKDDDNEIRIALRNQLQDDKNITLREISGEDKEKEKTTIEKCTGAIIFYGPNSNSKWYKARQDIVVDAENIKIRAVCLDASQNEIENRICKDVLINELLTIKGKNELRDKVNSIKLKLQTS